MKRILTFLTMAVIMSVAVFSCKDDFNEEDFLKLQSELKLKEDSIMRARSKALVDSTSKEAVQSYMSALNEAGDLMALTILIRDNDVPVEGVSVRLVSGTPQSSNGRAMAEQVSTTDASGNVTFDRVTIGQGTISISKTGFTPATALIDLCCIDTPVPVTVAVNGTSKTYYTVPPKQFRNMILPLYSKSGVATATIRGKVTIETDVTNLTPEVPQNITIAANYTSIPVAPGGGVAVTSYSFDDTNFASTTVNNTTGEYTLTVPAPVAGYNVGIIVPTIETNQKIAAAFVDGVAIATGPEYRNQATTFGPNAGTYPAVPQIFGAKAIFPAPPAPGRGFTITTPTPVPRSLPTGGIPSNTVTTSGNITFNFSNGGRGNYTSSPQVNISAGGGTGATALTTLGGWVTAANITVGGSGYIASKDYDLFIYYINAAGVFIPLNNTPIDVTTNSSGAFNLGTLTLPNAPGYSGHATAYSTTSGVQGFGTRVVGDGAGFGGAIVGPTSPNVSITMDNQINDVSITNGGSGYTSAPTFSFSGGGNTPVTAPSLTVTAFRTQFDFSLSSTNTTPYKVLPADFVFTYPANNVDGMTIEATAKVDRVSSSITGGALDLSLISQVYTDGTNILPLNPTYGFRTHALSVFPPVLSVKDLSTTKAVAFVNVSATGEVTGIEDPSTFTFATDKLGQGYDSYAGFAVVPSATTAPGSGALVSLTLANNVTTKVTSWSGASTLLSGGSGYLDELNQMRVPFPSGISPRSVSTSVSVSAGQTVIFNYNYGSGVPKVNLAGNFR